MRPVFTFKQYLALSLKQQNLLNEYKAEFFLNGDEGFWKFRKISLYGEGKAAHQDIECWVRENFPGADRITVKYL